MVFFLNSKISFSSKLNTSTSFTRTCPAVGSINLLMCLIKVDLPEPDRPMQTKISPSSIDNETLSKPTLCPVSSRTCSLSAPFWTIDKTWSGWGPNIL